MTERQLLQKCIVDQAKGKIWEEETSENLTCRGENRIWAQLSGGENEGLPTLQDSGCCSPGKRVYLDVVIFGACDHQVVVARRLVHCETHHRPDVATQLSHGLQPGCKGTGQLLLCAGAHPKGPPTQSLPQPWSAPEGLLPLGRVGTDTPLSVILGEEGSLGVC